MTEDQERFSTALRGYHRREVDAFVTDLLERIRGLEEDRDRLEQVVSDMAGRSPAEVGEEFERVTAEVGEILRTAWEAAEGMRSRASGEAARWREEARSEAAQARRDAQSDAEGLRRDAWNTAEELLDQVQQEAERQRRTAEREALMVQADAEREAHRLVTEARKEAEEQLRSARMEAERLLVEARSRHDEIVEAAHREAQNAQERARALESRRRELMEELETARGAIQRLEEDLQAKREALQSAREAVDGGTVRIIHPGDEAEDDEAPIDEWVDGGESVRILPAPPRRTEAAPEPEDAEAVDAEAMAAEVRELRTTRTDRPLEAGEGEDEDAPVDEAPAEEGPAPPAEAAAAPGDDLASLFAELREVEGPGAPAEAGQPVPDRAAAQGPVSLVLGERDPFELRDRLLLPVQNRVLRSVKRQLTEEQNVVLEELRVGDGDWNPEPSSLEERLHGDLVILAQEGFAAGLAAVADLTGEGAGRPRPEEADLPDRAAELAEALVETLRSELEAAREAGAGPRELAATISRVFRAWRTDETERRVRELALEAFHRGVGRALAAREGARVAWVVAGRGCPDCRAAAEGGPIEPGQAFFERLAYPPAHAGCACVLVPAGS